MNHPKSCRYRQAVFIGSETEHETQYGVFCCFKLSKCQFLRSLKTSTLGNRPSRHGLATAPGSKALQNWKIFLKALSKRLQKLTIKTKRLWQLKFLSFVKVND